MKMIMDFLQFTLLGVAIIRGVAAATAGSENNSIKQRFNTEIRQLENNNNNNNQKMVYGQCFWAQEYDNDSGTSKDVPYVSYYFCNAYKDYNYQDGSSGNYCPSSCAVPDNLYVIDLATYVSTNVQYLQNYCGNCNEYCDKNQNARRLEEGGANGNNNENNNNNEQNANYDCDSCSSTCTTINNYMNDDKFEDEANYMNCQAAFTENGIQYYSAPACGCDGGLIIGLYLDYQCTVKADRLHNKGHFSNSYFTTLEGQCLTPNNDNNNNNNNYFQKMMNNARMCDNAGNDLNGDDDNVDLCFGNYQTLYDEHSCDLAYMNERERVKSSGAQVFWTFAGLLAAVLLTCYCCSFLGKRAMVYRKNTVPLSSRDGSATTEMTTKRRRSFRR